MEEALQLIKECPEKVISALLKDKASRKQIVKKVSKLVNKGKILETFTDAWKHLQQRRGGGHLPPSIAAAPGGYTPPGQKEPTAAAAPHGNLYQLISTRARGHDVVATCGVEGRESEGRCDPGTVQARRRAGPLEATSPVIGTGKAARISPGTDMGPQPLPAPPARKPLPAPPAQGVLAPAV